MSFRSDPDAHNAEQKAVWEAFRAHKPIRVPMTLGIAIRYYIGIPEVNPRRYTYEQYTMDPDTMLEVQLAMQAWARDHINWCLDAEVGLPAENWCAYIDFHNCYEAAWFGAPIEFPADQVPTVRPILAGDRKNRLFDRGIPDPLHDGIMARVLQYYEHWKAKLRNLTFQSRPVKITGISGIGTDGPLTVAASLRGSDLFEDFYADPDYVRRLLDFIAEATIVRIKAWRAFLGDDAPPDWWGLVEGRQRWGFGDDSLQLISVEQYREFVLPVHKKLMDTFGKDGPNFIHLCGDASRHFRTLRDTLKIQEFDTGFPIDLAAVRRELGPEVTIYGGPPIQLLRDGPVDAIVKETMRVLDSGVREGGRFILREGNNLAPGTPLEHIYAMYETCRRFGGY